ncbi:MAG: spermidine/putrescine transport system ATP-binding protein [Gaiellales bacterium]|nr:spermidine/putrescine transport system ATP-binding protein [Gaiellales bacterium]MDX6591436.1 spermidine/putrescine transport system ATP-binding protein [Gaiellales bacterium]
MEQPDVRLERVTKRFGDVTAVDDLSLSFERGGFVALLGPSGCGKTTTLRMIGGFEEPTAGTVFLGEQDVTGLPPYKREVNTVFQNYALFPHMNIHDNIAFGIRQRGASKHEVARQVPEMLDLVQLTGFERRKPTQLSGGQAQRVALARALINKPRVLLLDEPLGALDLKLRKQMQIELKRIQTEVNITFIHVTHDQEEAMTMADRIAVMNQGRIEQLGPPVELYEQPRTAFVAGFLGVSNLLLATIAGAGRVRFADGSEAAVPEEALRGAPDEVRIGVRPEKVRLSTTDDLTNVNGSNSINGTVRDVSYIGVSTQYIIDTPAGDELTAIVQNAGRGARHLDRGQPVQVLWDPEHTFVITDTAAVPTLEELV